VDDAGEGAGRVGVDGDGAGEPGEGEVAARAGLAGLGDAVCGDPGVDAAREGPVPAEGCLLLLFLLLGLGDLRLRLGFHVDVRGGGSGRLLSLRCLRSGCNNGIGLQEEGQRERERDEGQERDLEEEEEERRTIFGLAETRLERTLRWGGWFLSSRPSAYKVFPGL